MRVRDIVTHMRALLAVETGSDQPKRLVMCAHGMVPW
jgi:hypothetical protein